MNQIISGVKYDTETAHLVGAYSYGSTSDCDYIRERLYQKKNGKLFLYGEGGPHTEYVEYSSYNSFGPGCKIIPLSEPDARAWAEKHCSVEAYEAVFGVVEE